MCHHWRTLQTFSTRYSLTCASGTSLLSRAFYPLHERRHDVGKRVARSILDWALRVITGMVRGSRCMESAWFQQRLAAPCKEGETTNPRAQQLDATLRQDSCPHPRTSLCIGSCFDVRSSLLASHRGRVLKKEKKTPWVFFCGGNNSWLVHLGEGDTGVLFFFFLPYPGHTPYTYHHHTLPVLGAAAISSTSLPVFLTSHRSLTIFLSLSTTLAVEPCYTAYYRLVLALAHTTTIGATSGAWTPGQFEIYVNSSR